MEVSSHALVMGRVDGFVFDVAVFLNLGRDHLDFHRDMDDYFDAKASLFSAEHARRGLVNVDDEWGRRLIDRATVPVADPLDRRRPRPTGARPTVELREDGATFHVVRTRGRRRGRLPDPGRVQRRQHAGRDRGGGDRRLRRAARSRTASPRAGRPRAGSSGSTRARTSRSSSTTRTSPTPSRRPSPRSARSPAAG